MDMSGEQLISASRDAVWKALNDPAVLQMCVPGCDQMEQTSETKLNARAAIKVGPIKAKFAGKIMLTDMNPPTSYAINFEGQGGIAGFAKGGARVSLTEAEGGTLLKYESTAKIGGKIAQLGARLIESTAKSMADQFFAKFSEIMNANAIDGASASEDPST